MDKSCPEIRRRVITWAITGSLGSTHKYFQSTPFVALPCYSSGRLHSSGASPLNNTDNEERECFQSTAKRGRLVPIRETRDCDSREAALPSRPGWSHNARGAHRRRGARWHVDAARTAPATCSRGRATCSRAKRRRCLRGLAARRPANATNTSERPTLPSCAGGRSGSKTRRGGTAGSPSSSRALHPALGFAFRS